MATQGCFVLLWLALVVVLGGAADRNCFNTDCGTGDSLSACVAGQWQCHHGEVCFMDIKHDSTVSMICVAANHAHCPLANHNDASCAPLVYPPPHDCLYCCDTEQCARNIEAGVAVLATHQAQQGCFAGLCDHHANLESCLQGQWQCNANQFCRFEAHRNGDIIMHCQETDQLAHCQDATYKNDQATCSRLDTLPPPTDCKYCCTDQSCIVNILTSSLHTTTTPAPKTPAPTTTTTTPAPTTMPAHSHLLHAGKASCFTSDCEHVDVAQCTSGQWACTAHQYCHVQEQSDGTLHMNCDDIAHYDVCLNHTSHNLPECSLSIQGHCQYCCSDADCVRRLASIPATQLVCMDNLPNNECSLVVNCTHLSVMEVCRKTCGVCGSSSVHTTAATASPSQTATATASPVQATSSTQSPPQTTAAPTQAPTQTTAAPTQAPTQTTAAPTQTTATASPTTTAAAATTTMCEDHYAGDCSVDFAGRCGDETIGHFLCPKFCGTCNTLPCRDLFTGDCSVTFAGRCNEPTILEICRQTCGGCAGPMTTTTVVPTTTTATTTTTSTPAPTTATTAPTPAPTTSTPAPTTAPTTTPTPAPTMPPATTSPTPAPTTLDGCVDKFHGDCSVALNGLCSFEVVATDLCQKTCNTCGIGPNSATTTSSNSGQLIG